MNRLVLAIVIFTAIAIWIQLVKVLGGQARKQVNPRRDIWSRPPEAFSRAAAVEARGIRIRSQNTSRVSSQTEVHMNPISALVFIVFIGGAVLARLADMPIAVTVILALIGIFL